MASHLVTGGSGYFGSILVRRLASDGHAVRVFDLRPFEAPPPGVEVVLGDVRDEVAVRRACEGVEVVHHNVAQVPLARDRELFWSVNRDGTRNLLAAAQGAGVRKVVYTSSSAVFGVPRTNPVTEETPALPAEEYGEAKLAGEELCRSWATRGLDVSIIRPRTILGHGRLGIFQMLFEWVRLGRNVPVLGAGDNVYQFVHAEDLADACLRAGERPGPATYNIGAERFGTMRDTLEGLCAYAGTGSRVVSVPMRPAVAGMRLATAVGLSPLAPYHWLMYGRSLWFDVAKAKRELGWSARFGNVEVLCDSYAWYLAHRDEVLAGRGGSRHQAAVRHGVLDLVSRLL